MEITKIEVTSKKFWLNSKDFLRGLIMAMGTGASMILIPVFTALQAGTAMHIDWNMAWKAALAAGGVYLLKNFFQDEKVKINATPEKIEELKNSVPTKEVAK